MEYSTEHGMWVGKCLVHFLLHGSTERKCHWMGRHHHFLKLSSNQCSEISRTTTAVSAILRNKRNARGVQLRGQETGSPRMRSANRIARDVVQKAVLPSHARVSRIP